MVTSPLTTRQTGCDLCVLGRLTSKRRGLTGGKRGVRCADSGRRDTYRRDLLLDATGDDNGLEYGGLDLCRYRLGVLDSAS